MLVSGQCISRHLRLDSRDDVTHESGLRVGRELLKNVVPSELFMLLIVIPTVDDELVSSNMKASTLSAIEPLHRHQLRNIGSSSDFALEAAFTLTPTNGALPNLTDFTDLGDLAIQLALYSRGCKPQSISSFVHGELVPVQRGHLPFLGAMWEPTAK